MLTGLIDQVPECELIELIGSRSEILLTPAYSDKVAKESFKFQRVNLTDTINCVHFSKTIYYENYINIFLFRIRSESKQ